jgi:hypothetical protein
MLQIQMCDYQVKIKSQKFRNNKLRIDEVTDGMIADDGEFYEGEKEGGDLKNRQSFKRAGSPIETELYKRNKDDL